MVTWSVRDDPGTASSPTTQLPDGVSAKLATFGAVSYAPANAGSYRTRRGARRGGAQQLVVRPGTSRLLLERTSKPSAAQVSTQTLYIARDARGRPVAQLWVNAAGPGRR